MAAPRGFPRAVRFLRAFVLRGPRATGHPSKVICGPLPIAGAGTQMLLPAVRSTRGGRRDLNSQTEPQIRRDYPLNLSISISGGKETNKDSLSNGERSGKSSSLKSLAVTVRELWPGEATRHWADAVKVDLERRVTEGESPVRGTVDQGRHCLQRVGLFGNAAQSGW